MALGALVLSPLADIFGRRPALIVSTLLMGLGSLLSAFCRGPGELLAARVVTGLGIGLAVALITSVAAEFSSARRRAFSMSAMAVGYPGGGLAGGLAAAVLLKTSGWQSVFIVGAVLGGMLFVLVFLGLPESPAFLAGGRTPHAHQRLDRVLIRLGRQPISREFADPSNAPNRMAIPYVSLFTPGLMTLTLCLAVVSLLYGMASYYVLSWLPQLVVKAGFATSIASLVSASASLVGIVSGLVLGLTATVVQPRRVTAAAMLGLGLSLCAFGYAPASLYALVATAVACGACLFGGVGVFYATLAASFPPLSRITGVGFVMSVGRLSSAIGPYLAGRLFHAGWNRGGVSLIFAVGATVGAWLLLRAGPARSKLEC